MMLSDGIFLNLLIFIHLRIKPSFILLFFSVILLSLIRGSFKKKEYSAY